MNLLNYVMLLNCIYIFVFQSMQATQSDHSKIACRIRNQVMDQLSVKHKLCPVADSAGMMDCVYMVGFMFEKRSCVEKDEARELIVDCVETMIKSVNQNTEIRPYLMDYPFTTKNVSISIFFGDKNGGFLFHPAICTVSVSESDEIFYHTTDPFNPNQYKSTVKESYKEALEIVKSKQKSVQN